MTHRFAPLLTAVIGMLMLAGTPGWAAEGGHEPPPRESWSFAGPFGTFDRAQIQRGFKVYREVCANCHAMALVPFRSLGQPGALGYSDPQIRALAAEYKIQDGPDDQGEMFERPGRPSDHFPKPFPNDAAARVANGGALPPDLSLIVKARTYERGFPLFLLDPIIQYQEHGADYLHAVLVGYRDPPAGVEPRDGLHYNAYFPGNWIAMPQPLSDGQVEYTDGTPTTVDQYSRDVTAFLAWAAEPHLEARKRIGLQVMVFLLVFAGLLYYTKKKIWSRDLHHA